MAKAQIMTNEKISFIMDYINQSYIMTTVTDEGEEVKEDVFPIKDKIQAASTKARWRLRNNLNRIGEVYKVYIEALNEIQSKYMDDEHSHPDILKDDNGIPKLDKEGKEQPVRMINPEFIEEYSNQRNELLKQENEILISMVNIDDFTDANLTFDDFEAFSFMILED